MVLSLLLLKLTGWFAANALSLGVLIVVGALVYLLALNVLDRAAIEQIRQLIRAQVRPVDSAAPQMDEASEPVDYTNPESGKVSHKIAL